MVCVKYSGMLYVFCFFCHVLHNFHSEAKRVYIWLYLESVKYSGILYVFWFVCHVLHNFPFWGKMCIYLIISGICEIFWILYVFFVMGYIIFHFEAKRVYIWNLWNIHEMFYVSGLFCNTGVASSTKASPWSLPMPRAPNAPPPWHSKTMTDTGHGACGDGLWQTKRWRWPVGSEGDMKNQPLPRV